MVRTMTGPPRPEYEYISPERAEHLLNNMAMNRRIKQHRVQALTRAMEQGEFDSFNGETIKIDEQGRAIDGQHRLRAIVASGKGQEILVVRGVRPEAIYTVDGGIPRSLSDALGIRGEKSGSYLATAIRGAHAFKQGYMGQVLSSHAPHPSVPEALEMLRVHPSLREAALVSGRLTSRSRDYGKFLTPAAYGPLWWAFSRYDEAEANFFFDRLTMGDDIGAESPIWVLRRSLTNLRSRTGHGFSSQLDLAMAITVKAWNAWMTGRTVSTLRWRAGGSQEAEVFPAIVGEEQIWASIHKEESDNQDL